MKRTELFKQMKTWKLGEIVLFAIYILIELPVEKIIDSVMAVASDNEINGGLQKMGKGERIT
jgi:hypothetical protein